MGTDIHVTVQLETNSGYEDINLDFYPFDNRNYGVFGFLADVRNYSHVPPISPRRGYPTGYEIRDGDDHYDYHSASWLTVNELANFNYDTEFEDRRTMKEVFPGHFNGAWDAGEGNGRITTFRAFLMPSFFDDLEKLIKSGASRIVFDFDT